LEQGGTGMVFDFVTVVEARFRFFNFDGKET